MMQKLQRVACQGYVIFQPWNLSLYQSLNCQYVNWQMKCFLACPNRKIFSQYSRLSFSAVRGRRIWRFAFDLLVLISHKTALENN